MGGTIRPKEHRIASGLASNIAVGDVVKLLATGYIDRAAAGDTNLIGVFGGVQWTDTDGTVRFSSLWPTGTATQGAADAMATVYEDPNIAYFMQCATGVAFAQTHVGNNADFVYTAPDTLLGRAKSALDLSTVGTATANFRILGLGPQPANGLGDSAIVEVRFNEHLLLSATGI